MILLLQAQKEVDSAVNMTNPSHNLNDSSTFYSLMKNPRSKDNQSVHFPFNPTLVPSNMDPPNYHYSSRPSSLEYCVPSPHDSPTKTHAKLHTESRRSSDETTTPIQESIFHCHHHMPMTKTTTNTTTVQRKGRKGLCHWFYPSQFFHPIDGIGRLYSNHLQYMEELRQNRSLWMHMPPIYLHTIALHPDMDWTVTFRKQPFTRCNITMIHVHKTGGTSMVNAYQYLHKTFGMDTPNRDPLDLRQNATENKKDKKKTIQRKNTTLPDSQLDTQSLNTYSHHENKYAHIVYSSKTKPHLNPSPYVQTLLDHAVQYPSQNRPKENLLIAIVRDPVERFISAIGQAMGAPGSKRNGTAGQNLRSQCVDSLRYDDSQESSHASPLNFQNHTFQHDRENSPSVLFQNNDTSSSKVQARRILQCVIQYIQQHGFWFELHFTPMVLEIAFVTGIENNIPVAIFPFKALPSVLYELGANPRKKWKDGSKPGFRPDPILTQMNVDDFDDDMLFHLCQIYRMDVEFMRSLGFSTRCDHLFTMG